jgi:hypothetical protein
LNPSQSDYNPEIIINKSHYIASEAPILLKAKTKKLPSSNDQSAARFFVFAVINREGNREQF